MNHVLFFFIVSCLVRIVHICILICLNLFISYIYASLYAFIYILWCICISICIYSYHTNMHLFMQLFISYIVTHMHLFVQLFVSYAYASLGAFYLMCIIFLSLSFVNISCAHCSVKMSNLQYIWWLLSNHSNLACPHPYSRTTIHKGFLTQST